MELRPTKLSRALSTVSRATSAGVRSTTWSIAAVTTYACGAARRTWRSAASSARASSTSSSRPNRRFPGSGSFTTMNWRRSARSVPSGRRCSSEVSIGRVMEQK